MEMLLTGDFIDAEKALNIGLVNQVVPVDSLDEATMILAEKIASNPPAAIRMGKAFFISNSVSLWARLTNKPAKP